MVKGLVRKVFGSIISISKEDKTKIRLIENFPNYTIIGFPAIVNTNTWGSYGSGNSGKFPWFSKTFRIFFEFPCIFHRDFEKYSELSENGGNLH